MTDINCTVRTCKYWGKGNKCTASSITVENDTDKPTAFMEIASERDLNPMATTSSETACKTFKPK